MRNDWDILVGKRWWMSRADIDVLYYRWKSGQIQVGDEEMLREFQAVRSEEIRIEAAETPEPPAVFMFGGMLDAMFGKTPNGQK